MAFEGVNGVVASSIEGINGVAKGNIQEINGAAPAAPPAGTSRVALAVGEGAHVMWCTSSTLTSAADWTLLDLGAGGFDDVAWGYDASDNEVWILTKDSTTIPMKIAVSDGSDNWAPSASANWTDVRPNGSSQLIGKGHKVKFADTGSILRPTWAMTSISNEEYVYYITGSITDTSAWQVHRAGFDSLAGNDDTFRPPPTWNRSASASESVFTMAGNNNGSIFSSINGTGSENAGDWAIRYNPGGSNANNKGDGGYGAGVWVYVGQQTAEDHVTGSSDGQTWGALNEPAANRPMLGVATDMAGKWVTVGKNGYVWYSSDNAVTWSEYRCTGSSAGVYRDMRDIAYDNNGTWLIIGVREFWSTSVDPVSSDVWTPYDVDASSNVTYNACAFNVENSSQ
jgi:hypothetical protein